MYLIQNKIFEGLRPRDSEYLLVEGDSGCESSAQGAGFFTHSYHSILWWCCCNSFPDEEIDQGHTARDCFFLSRVEDTHGPLGLWTLC